MGSLTKLQVHMLKTLIDEPLKAFKLRKKYTRAFDYMFKHAFGKSFGVEIEINPNFYKNYGRGCFFFSTDLEHHSHTKKITKIEKDLKSGYKTRRHLDSGCHEYTFPVRAQNLHLVYMYLKRIRKELVGELGVGNFDTSSSMHIHLIPPSVNPNYVDLGIYHYFNTFESRFTNRSHPQENCIEANRMLVLKPANPARHVRNCHMCHGCQYSILNHVNNPAAFKEHLKVAGRRRVVVSSPDSGRISSHYVYTDGTLVRKMYRLLYLLKDGPRKAEKIYLHALQLTDAKYRTKIAFLLGQFKEERFEVLLDHSIAYFIPYMSGITVDGQRNHILSGLDDSIQYNSGYNTIEIRLFAGSTNFSTIMKRALMYNSLKTLHATSDPTLLNLFLDII